MDEALEAAGLPPTLAVITAPHPAGLRGELETWLAAVTKRDPSEPMVAPLRVDGLVVLKADAAASTLQAWILDQLADLSRIQPDTLVRQRFEKFRAIGPVVSMEPPEPAGA